MGALLKAVMANSNTTVAGIATIVVAVVAVILAYADGDPETMPNWDVAIAAITAGIGLLSARDADKSTEDSTG
jgi:hypothetical protein|tara:strand:+ start:38 stop:256 length:219 start_codon:yes stop_codon:yes gene_type:complete